MTSLEKQLRDFKKQGGWVDVRYNGNLKISLEDWRNKNGKIQS